MLQSNVTAFSHLQLDEFQTRGEVLGAIKFIFCGKCFMFQFVMDISSHRTCSFIPSRA